MYWVERQHRGYSDGRLDDNRAVRAFSALELQKLQTPDEYNLLQIIASYDGKHKEILNY